MSESTTPKPAPTLGAAGTELWREIVTTGAYDLRPDELRILTDACRQADLIDAMEAELSRDLAEGLFKVKGSQGQPVINPLIAEIRQHRATLTSMLAKLKLPDTGDESDGAGDVNPRSVAARAAANARWNKRPG